MTVRNTVYRSDQFALCVGEMTPMTHFSLVMRNVNDPQSINGNMTQWLYIVSGSGKIITDDGFETYVERDEFMKLPDLYGKRIIWYSFNEGARWVAFNPIPYNDDYTGKKNVLDPGTSFQLPTVAHERFLVLLDGDITMKNEQGVTKSSQDESDTFVVKISAQSIIDLTSKNGAVIGVFWKSNLKPSTVAYRP